MKKRSPKALPPSPVPIVMPFVVRAILPEAGGVLVLQQFLRQHGHGAGRVDERLRELGARRAGPPCRVRPDSAYGICVRRLREDRQALAEPATVTAFHRGPQPRAGDWAGATDAAHPALRTWAGVGRLAAGRGSRHRRVDRDRAEVRYRF